MREDEHQKHLRFFEKAKKLLTGTIVKRFGFVYDTIPAEYEPCLILANHNTDADPVLLGVAVERHCYFVSTENVMRSPLLGGFLKRYLSPIIHYKGKLGTVSVKNILKTLSSGYSVAMFAEGNRSFNGVTCPISPATIKLARKCRANVVTYRFEGGYLSQPRWSRSFRKGTIRGRLVRVYSPMELKAMTDEEAYEDICADLYEDAYATQEREHERYIGKAPAEYLETALFMCPECGVFGTMHSKDDRFSCSECGYGARFDDEGYLRDLSGKRTVTELDGLQREALRKRAQSPAADVLFTDEVSLWKIEDHRAVKKIRGKLTGFSTGFMFNGSFISAGDLEGMALFSRNTIDVTMKDSTQYEIHGKKDFNALKYYYLYEILKEKEQ